MDVGQFRDLILLPTLEKLPFRNDKAVQDLMLGTALHESGGLRYIKQIKGPALSFFQIEPATHDDIWSSFLAYRPELAGIVGEFGSTTDDLVSSLTYPVVIARIVYARVPERIPDTLQGQANYWKAHYNVTGKGTTQLYLASFFKHTGRMPE